MISSLFRGYAGVVRDTFTALIPLLTIFLIYQFAYLKLSRRRFHRILKGVLLAFVGLTLFLQGVNVGYIDVGKVLGEVLASLPYNWILVPLGFLLGFAVTLAEPSVYVLVQEIDKVTAGAFPKRVMLIALSIGVAISVSLAMVKTLLNISLWFFMVPGYLLALVLTYFVAPNFTSIAFDAGGVATGTMTATFLLSLSLGVATQMEHADPLLDGFGIIGLVALMPILTVLSLGLIQRVQERRARGLPKKRISDKP